MDWWLLTFFLGAILSLFLPIVPAISYVICFALIGIVLLRYKSSRNSSGLLFGMAWLLYCGSQYQNLWQANELNQPSVHQQTHLVRGDILTIPTNTNTNQRFNFNVYQFDNVALDQPIIIRLSWDNAPEYVLQGQKWQLTVKIKPAHGLANIGGFSYQTWLRQKKIIASGYVINSSANNKKKIKNKVGNILLSDQVTFRQQLFNQSKLLVKPEPLSALLFALSFGERSEISTPMWQVLQKTSTQHLIAISGLHLGLMATMSFYLSLLILRFIPLTKFTSVRCQQNLSANNLNVIAMVFSGIITVFYAYLAGFSLPTVRALIMLCLYWAARCCGVNFTLRRALLVAVFVIVTLFPFSLFSISFWLSFYAVCIIFLVLWRFSMVINQQQKVLSWFTSLIVVQLAFSLLMLPVVAVVNPQFSLVALFANIVAVPLMSFTAIPLCLIAVVFLPINESVSIYLFDVALSCLQFLWQWLSYLSSFSWATVPLASYYIIGLSLLIYVVFIGIFLSPSKRVFVQLSAVFIMIAGGHYYLNEKQKSWQVNVMDVGQGLAIIIEKNGKAILYDTGASYPSGFNMVEAVIIPYLQKNGISELDKVIISHSDNDHAGGLKKLDSLITINEVVMNDKSSNYYIVNPSNNYCQSGNEFLWQGLSFTMLAPNKVVGEHNDDSCVINISDGKSSVLLTGDISAKVERKLLRQYNDKLIDIKASVLIAPHHGSKTSSSTEFIRAVSPELVIFSAGYLNRWQMPVKTVVKRYEQQGISHLTTAKSGMIILNIDNEGIKAKEYRRHLWPYWFAN